MQKTDTVCQRQAARCRKQKGSWGRIGGLNWVRVLKIELIEAKLFRKCQNREAIKNGVKESREKKKEEGKKGGERGLQDGMQATLQGRHDTRLFPVCREMLRKERSSCAGCRAPLLAEEGAKVPLSVQKRKRKEHTVSGETWLRPLVSAGYLPLLHFVRAKSKGQAKKRIEKKNQIDNDKRWPDFPIRVRGRQAKGWFSNCSKTAKSDHSSS